jgi:hypothetical protein
MDAGAVNVHSQDSSAQQAMWGVKLALGEIQIDEKQELDEKQAVTGGWTKHNESLHSGNDLGGARELSIEDALNQADLLNAKGVTYNNLTGKAWLHFQTDKQRIHNKELEQRRQIGGKKSNRYMWHTFYERKEVVKWSTSTASSEKQYDAEADKDDVAVEVVAGDGGTRKFTLPPTATVLMLKQQVERDAGFKPALVKLYVQDDSREEELENGERLGSLRQGRGQAVLITLMVHTPNAQEMIAGMAAKADIVLGDGTEGDGDGQLSNPYGVAFVPAHPDWVVTTEYGNIRTRATTEFGGRGSNGNIRTEFYGHRIKISNIRTGALICKFGSEEGRRDEMFSMPWGVAVTSDSSFVIVAEIGNHRIKMLRLVVAADGSSAHLEFVRHIGCGGSGKRGTASKTFTEGRIYCPVDVALVPGEGGGQDTVLVTEQSNHRVSQFKLDGTFIRIFAGTYTPRSDRSRGSSGDGEFSNPRGITVLGSSGEVAVADFSDHRVQIFDREGNYKRKLQRCYGPSALASDAARSCPRRPAVRRRAPRARGAKPCPVFRLRCARRGGRAPPRAGRAARRQGAPACPGLRQAAGPGRCRRRGAAAQVP